MTDDMTKAQTSLYDFVMLTDEDDDEDLEDPDEWDDDDEEEEDDWDWDDEEDDDED